MIRGKVLSGGSKKTNERKKENLPEQGKPYTRTHPRGYPLH